MTVKTKIIDSSCLVFPFKRHRPRFLSALQDAGILYGQYSIKRRPPQPNKKRHPKGCLFGGDQPRNPKIKDRRWRSFILFYFVNTTGFVILPRIPQGRERVRGEPLPGFPSRCGPSRPMARYKRFAAGKILAQAEFTSAEHVQSPWGGAASRRGTQK